MQTQMFETYFEERILEKKQQSSTVLREEIVHAFENFIGCVRFWPRWFMNFLEKLHKRFWRHDFILSFINV